MMRFPVCAALVFAGSMAALCPARGQASSTPAATAIDSLTRAHLYVRWFYEGSADSVWVHVSHSGQLALGSVAPIKDDMRKIASWGRELSVLDERFVKSGDRLEYRRIIRTEKKGKPMLISLTTNAQGALVGWEFNSGSVPKR